MEAIRPRHCLTMLPTTIDKLVNGVRNDIRTAALGLVAIFERARRKGQAFRGPFCLPSGVGPKVGQIFGKKKKKNFDPSNDPVLEHSVPDIEWKEFEAQAASSGLHTTCHDKGSALFFHHL